MPASAEDFGFLVIEELPDGDALVDTLIDHGYPEEFCAARSFDQGFIERLISSGFLVMSAAIADITILLPKLHLVRSVLPPQAVHESRTARRLAPHYELRCDESFDSILERCAAVHGEDWLTQPLRQTFSRILHSPGTLVRARCFSLWKNGVLVAGEFGFQSGGVYTSYSGYRDEDNAGTVQLILTGRQLTREGCALWDLGMPMNYKAQLGAQELSREAFISLYRTARAKT